MLYVAGDAGRDGTGRAGVEPASGDAAEGVGVRGASEVAQRMQAVGEQGRGASVEPQTRCQLLGLSRAFGQAGEDSETYACDQRDGQCHAGEGFGCRAGRALRGDTPC